MTWDACAVSSQILFDSYKHFQKGLPSQATEALKEHLTASDWYGFDDDHIQTFVKNMKRISETKIESDEDLKVLRKRLYEPDDFQVLVFECCFG